jgi:hypothetical protein
MSGRVWSFTLTGPAFSANDRLHWAERNRRTQEWRKAGGWTAKQKRIPRLEKARIDVEWVVPDDWRHRDAGNVYPAAKALTDGICLDAKVLQDDDSTRLDGPVMRMANRGSPKPGRGTWTVNVIVTEVTA